jgi:phenylacetic acid degradation operon negative regulatory protein
VWQKQAIIAKISMAFWFRFVEKCHIPNMSAGYRPQSLIFTLFGDYICNRSERVWIGTLIRILALFNVSEAAVRSTVSRMSRRGWLKNERFTKASYYLLTARARKVLAEGTERIGHFSDPIDHWDSSWHLVTYSIPETMRNARARFRSELSTLGFGMLTNAAWLSPCDKSVHIQQLTASLHIQPYVHLFHGELGGLTSCRDLAARCWDLETINSEYAQFIKKHDSQLAALETRAGAGGVIEPSEFFIKRFTLLHDYRRFPYRDPQLPHGCCCPTGTDGKPPICFKSIINYSPIKQTDILILSSSEMENQL